MSLQWINLFSNNTSFTFFKPYVNLDVMTSLERWEGAGLRDAMVYDEEVFAHTL